MTTVTEVTAVYASYVDRRYLLGYAVGRRRDIEAYFDDRKVYGLEFVNVIAIHIPPGYAEKKEGLMGQKAQLEKELRELEDKIKLQGEV